MKNFRNLWEGWKQLTAYLGDFQARWLLTVFYFTIALPFGMIERALDPLKTRRAPVTSAWEKRETEESDIQTAKRPY